MFTSSFCLLGSLIIFGMSSFQHWWTRLCDKPLRLWFVFLTLSAHEGEDVLLSQFPEESPEA